MKRWLLLGDVHINLERVDAFWHDLDDGSTHIGVGGMPKGIRFPDDDERIYKKLCMATGEEPAEGWKPLEKYGE